MAEQTTEMVNETEGAEQEPAMGENDAQSPEELKAELEAARAALHKANKEAASRRKALEAFEAKEEERRQAEMSELEKAQAKIAELEAERANAQQEITNMRIRTALTAAATQLNFHNPDDAAEMVDWSGLSVEDGKVEGVEQAVKQLVKDRPYLIKTAAAPEIDAAKGGKGKKDGKAKDEGLARAYGIRI